MHFSVKETAVLITREIYSSPCIRAAASGLGQRIIKVFNVHNPFSKQELALQPSTNATSVHHLFFFSFWSRERVITRSYSVCVIPLESPSALKILRGCHGPTTLFSHYEHEGKRAFYIQLWIAFCICIHVVYTAFFDSESMTVHTKTCSALSQNWVSLVRQPCKRNCSEMLVNGSKKDCQSLKQSGQTYFICFNNILYTYAQNWMLLGMSCRYTYLQARLENNMPQQQRKLFIWRWKHTVPLTLSIRKTIIYYTVSSHFRLLFNTD